MAKIAFDSSQSEISLTFRLLMKERRAKPSQPRIVWALRLKWNSGRGNVFEQPRAVLLIYGEKLSLRAARV